ncbi:MAG: P1 family peptidase [Dehalococcoidia bacterium]
MSAGWQSGPNDAITDVRGIRVGHWTDRRAATGCTVIRCDEATFVAVDTRGGAPGTRETEVLGPANIVRRAHAIVLTGGSAFGLASATGVMRYLSEQGVGFPTTAMRVPIVPAAVLYDLGLGKPDAFPGAEEGYVAARRAKAGKVEQGSVGAGTGATVAKLLGMEHALKGGLGTASVAGPRGFIVGAIVATNAVGGVSDPDTGRVLAGPRAEKGRFVPLPVAMERRTAQMDALLENTVVICVATNAALDHHQVQRLAIQAHDGLARTVFPAHTFGDGDVAFAIAMGQVPAKPDDATVLGMMTTRAVERAIISSIRQATTLAGVPSAGDFIASSSRR